MNKIVNLMNKLNLNKEDLIKAGMKPHYVDRLYAGLYTGRTNTEVMELDKILVNLIPFKESCQILEQNDLNFSLFEKCMNKINSIRLILKMKAIRRDFDLKSLQKEFDFTVQKQKAIFSESTTGYGGSYFSDSEFKKYKNLAKLPSINLISDGYFADILKNANKEYLLLTADQINDIESGNILNIESGTVFCVSRQCLIDPVELTNAFIKDAICIINSPIYGISKIRAEDQLRNKLNELLNQKITKSSNISEMTGISKADLSQFKNQNGPLNISSYLRLDEFCKKIKESRGI